MAADFSLYPYTPNKPLPIIWSVIVLGLGIFHWIQTIHRYKWPRFGGMMVWATAVWLAGFICRAYSVWHTDDIPTFICQYVLILAGPPIFAAAESFILGRLYAYLPYHALIHPGRVLSTFIFLGIAVEVLSGNGASRLAQHSDDQAKDMEAHQVGSALIKSALILQAVIEMFFFSLVGWLQYRCTRPGNYFPHNVKVMCYLLYVTSSMMFVRCIVRVVETFEQSSCGGPTASNPLGYCGAVSTNEWFLWVFEVANITLFVAALAIFTPGKYLSRDDKIFLDPRDGVTERQGPGYAQIDKRPFLVTVFDPFNFGAIFRKKQPFQEFWLEEWPVAEADRRNRKGVTKQEKEAETSDNEVKSQV